LRIGLSLLGSHQAGGTKGGTVQSDKIKKLVAKTKVAFAAWEAVAEGNEDEYQRRRTAWYIAEDNLAEAQFDSE